MIDRPHDHPLLLACRRLGRAMDLYDDACCRVLDLNRSDLRALNLLEEGPVPMRAIAEALGLTPGSVTPLVDRLVRRGWVRRVPSEEDRRSTSVRLEPEARQALARVYEPLGRGVLGAFVHRSERERARMAAGMEQTADAFDRGRAELLTARRSRS